jgi:hypothetical protein
MSGAKLIDPRKCLYLLHKQPHITNTFWLQFEVKLNLGHLWSILVERSTAGLQASLRLLDLRRRTPVKVSNFTLISIAAPVGQVSHISVR